MITWKSNQGVRKSNDGALNLVIGIIGITQILNQLTSTVVAEGTVANKNNSTRKILVQPVAEIFHRLFYRSLNVSQSPVILVKSIVGLKMQVW